MTAIMPEPRTALDTAREKFDQAALREDLIAVLAMHGLLKLDSVTLDVVEINQGGEFAGVSITASAYERPGTLPPPMTRAEYDRSLVEGVEEFFAGMAERLRADRSEDDEQKREGVA
ncbi:hypothetical protein AB0C69_28495 [Actinomadura sp. NPDC048032]|uniref:hypothetical protein n=1 Tax=Actinomadura sp. NPDC048032 TaxID=3155747 RepID=UPI0033E31BB0